MKATDANGRRREARASSNLDVTVRVDRGYLRQRFLLSEFRKEAEAWTYEARVRYVTYYAQINIKTDQKANIRVTTYVSQCVAGKGRDSAVLAAI